jgi:TonB family protein
MTATVDEVIGMRRPDTRGLNRMVTISLMVHLTAVAVVFLVPRDWLGKQKAAPILMTLSLTSGSEGEKTGGMNPAPARPIEEVKPPPKRPEPIRPSEPKSDVMTVPSKTPPKTPPKPTTKPPAPIARPPSTGAQIRQGTSRAETGSTVQGTGLSMGGGAGASATIEAVDFCCMEWAQDMIRQIQMRWRSNQAEPGETILRFTVQRDGTITDVDFDKRSGSGILDRASLDALPAKLAQPLPREYPENQLVIHLKFPYQARE